MPVSYSVCGYIFKMQDYLPAGSVCIQCQVIQAHLQVSPFSHDICDSLVEVGEFGVLLQCVS